MLYTAFRLVKVASKLEYIKGVSETKTKNSNTHKSRACAITLCFPKALSKSEMRMTTSVRKLSEQLYFLCKREQLCITFM